MFLTKLGFPPLCLQEDWVLMSQEIQGYIASPLLLPQFPHLKSGGTFLHPGLRPSIVGIRGTHACGRALCIGGLHAHVTWCRVISMPSWILAGALCTDTRKYRWQLRVCWLPWQAPQSHRVINPHGL